MELRLRQAKFLVDLFGDIDSEDDMIELVEYDETAHSGPGLYAVFVGAEEEGSVFLPANDEEQARAARLEAEQEAMEAN